MSRYKSFDNESSKRSLKLCRFLRSNRKCEQDKRFQIEKMTVPYSTTSPYSKIIDFNSKTKLICNNTDLSMFLNECKVIFVGDESCGKTSLVKRFTSPTSGLDCKATLEAEYETKFFNILDVDYNVCFWDLPGDEKFNAMSRPYYKNSNVVVVVFDLTRTSTLTNAARWMRETLSSNLETDPIRFLVGTKSDLLSKRTLEGLEAHANVIAQELDAEYFSVSSKDGTEVDNLFRRFTALAFENSIQKLIRPPDYHTVKNNISSEYQCG